MKSNSAIKRYGWTIAKLAIGGLIIYYVIWDKMIDFVALKSVLCNPLYLFVSFFVFSVATLSISTRWFLLVRAQGLALSYKEMIQLTMIGIFFNTFMPGSVGGDLIKAWYIAGQEPKRKTKAIFTVLFDRTIGLSVLVGYSSVTLLFFTKWLREWPELQALGYSIWAFTGGAIVFLALFYYSAKWKSPFLKEIVQVFYRFKPFGKVLDAFLLYRNHLKVIILSCVLSCVSISSIILLFSFYGHVLGMEMPIYQYFFLVPLGLTFSAIPLLPGGVGVGQVAFYTLFLWLGMPHPEQGGTLCTVFQVYMALFNCMGAFFYLRFKRRPRTASIESIAVPSVSQ